MYNFLFFIIILMERLDPEELGSCDLGVAVS